MFTPWTTTATPARIGWFNASMDRDADVRRYWDGERWSMPAYVDDRPEVLERAMSTPADPADVIPWRDLTEQHHAVADELAR